MKRYLTIQKIAAEVIDSLGIDAQYKSWAMRTLLRGYLDMRPASLYEEKVFSQEITDVCIPKPCDFVLSKKVTINGYPVYYRSEKKDYEQHKERYLPIVSRPEIHTVYEDQFHFYISSNAVNSGCVFELVYQSFASDENGFPMFDIVYQEPLEKWLKYKWIQRNIMVGTNKFTTQQEKLAQQEYTAERKKAKAKELTFALPDDVMDQLAAKWTDEFYVSENQFSRRNQEQNTVCENNIM